jgi:hypothetical protein
VDGSQHHGTPTPAVQTEKHLTTNHTGRLGQISLTLWIDRLEQSSLGAPNPLTTPNVALGLSTDAMQHRLTCRKVNLSEVSSRSEKFVDRSFCSRARLETVVVADNYAIEHHS